MDDKDKQPKRRTTQVTAIGFASRVARPGATEPDQTVITQQHAEITRAGDGFRIRWKDRREDDSRSVVVPMSNVAWYHEQES